MKQQNDSLKVEIDLRLTAMANRGASRHKVAEAHVQIIETKSGTVLQSKTERHVVAGPIVMTMRMRTHTTTSEPMIASMTWAKTKDTKRIAEMRATAPVSKITAIEIIVVLTATEMVKTRDVSLTEPIATSITATTTRSDSMTQMNASVADPILAGTVRVASPCRWIVDHLGVDEVARITRKIREARSVQTHADRIVQAHALTADQATVG